MESFSAYGHYFRNVSVYQNSFKEVFAVSPHEYNINLSVYYYNKYRAVSMSALGVSDLALDNDLFGYSPYFYFNKPSLKTLFPICFELNKYAYIKLRFILATKFYKDYSEFINKLTRINFVDTKFKTYDFRFFDFAFSNFNSNTYIVKDAFIFKRRSKKRVHKSLRVKRAPKRFNYIQISETVVHVSRPSSRPHAFRVFSNPMLSLPRKSKLTLSECEFIFKKDLGVHEFLRVGVRNRAFCLSQLFIPFLQRFVRLSFKLERKLRFVEFYLGSGKIIFAKFFNFAKKFLQKFFSEIKKFCKLTIKSVSHPIFYYFIFLSNQISRLSAFFVSLVVSLVKGPQIQQLNISYTHYKFLLLSFILRSIICIKFTFAFMLFNLWNFKFISRPYVHFKIPGNFKSVFFLQYRYFKNIFYHIIFSYFSRLGLAQTSLKSLEYYKIFSEFYNFSLKKICSKSTNFFKPLDFSRTNVSEFFENIESIDLIIPDVFLVSHFTGPNSENTKNFENFQYARYFYLTASVYAINFPKINFSKINFRKAKGLKKHKAKRSYFCFYFPK